MTAAELSSLGFDATRLHAAYAAGLAPEAVIGEVWRRIEAAGRDEAEARAEATALPPFDPAAYPLWGLPFAIKDNIDLAGAPTTAACPAYAYAAAEDAFVVAALRRAGAIPVGKTNLDQFATGLVGVRSPYPPPRNALDPAIVPGGSSSGSAVAVALDLVCFALGTDTAGSGRVPAALNAIVGLKPTLGALSARGVVPACRTLDTVSVFAQSVPDAWRVFAAASVYDPADAYARRWPAASLGAPPPSLRVGVPDAAGRLFFGDAAQEAAFAADLDRLAALGATIVPLDFAPFFAVARMLYEGAWVAERLSVVEELLARDPEAVHPVTRGIVEGAQGLSAVDAFRGFYRLAELRRAAEAALDGVDLLCVPTIPYFVTLEEIAADPLGPNARLGTYTNFVNLLDLCGIAVPTAPRSDGRPGSVTLLARAGRDGLAAGLADALQRAGGLGVGAKGRAVAAPPPGPAAAGPDETAIAVVGAHMSGLPLNRDLTARGARFLEATATAPEYRLYALPGGPPARPGLLRVGPEDGAAVAIEIWALPSAQVGDFLATVPAPLAIGSVRTAAGGLCKGFLVESAAVAGARDITAFGGWRAFLAAG